MSLLPLLLTGADGQLGRTVRTLWPTHAVSKRFALHARNRQQLDITDPAAVADCVERLRPTVIINAAAYANVDRAEEDEAQGRRAIRVNGVGVGYLARAAARAGSRLIHISSDYVFDGREQRPWPPDATLRPLNAYGRSKRAGEVAVARDGGGRALTVRTSWLYSPYGSNFLLTIMRLLRERDSLAVVDDQTGSPTSAFSLARALFALALRNSATGIYHWSDSGATTWFGFATAIRAGCLERGLPVTASSIKPVSSVEYAAPAPRPRYGVLDTGRIQAELGLAPRPWQDELAAVLDQLAELAAARGETSGEADDVGRAKPAADATTVGAATAKDKQ